MKNSGRIKNLECKVQQQARQLKDKHNQIEKLKRNYHQLEQCYGEIWLNEKLRRIKNLECKVQQQARQLKDK